MTQPKPSPVLQLTLCGEALHGADWHRPMATSLRRYHVMSPRPSLDYRIIRKWVVADRPVPAWVIDVLPRLLAAELARRPEDAAVLEQLADELHYPNLRSIDVRQGL
ncbi:MAG: hypothetical protein ACRYG8_03590 [Janthinobacterium lividum]